MKNKYNFLKHFTKISMLFLVVAMLIVTKSTTVHAASNKIYGSVWFTDLHTSNSGMNRYITVDVTFSTASYQNIRMLGKNGEIIWEEPDAINNSTGFRRFWCGPDVYRIQIRAGTGAPASWGVCNVFYQ